MKKHILTISSALLLFLYLFSPQLSAQQKFDTELKKRGLLKPIGFANSDNTQANISENVSSTLETQLGDLSIIGANGTNETLSIEFIDGFYFVLGTFNKELSIESTTIQTAAGKAFFLAKFDSNFNLLDLKEIGSGFLEIHGIIPFQNDLLVYGLADSTATLNGHDFAFNTTNAVLGLISTDMETKWRKTFAGVFNGIRYNYGQIILEVNGTNIFFTDNYLNIKVLNSNGDYLKDLSLGDGIMYYRPGIKDLKSTENGLIVVGDYERMLDIYGIFLDSDPSFSSSFIASLDISSSSANWAYSLSHSAANSSSYYDEIFIEPSGNILTTGRFSGALSWQNNNFSTETEQGTFVSRFLIDGTHDSTFVIHQEQIRYSTTRSYNLTYLNERLLLSAGFYDLYFNQDTISRGEILSIDLSSTESISISQNIDEEIENTRRLQAVNNRIFLSGNEDNDGIILQTNESLSQFSSVIPFNSPLAGRLFVYDVLDHQGSKYITCFVKNKAIIADSTIENDFGLAVVKITQGEIQWIEEFKNASSNAYMHDAVFVMNEHLYISGYVNEAEPTVFEEIEAEVKGSFIAKLDLSGEIQWVHSFGKYFSFKQTGYDDNIYISGVFYDSLKVNEEYVPSIQNNTFPNLITLKFNEEGKNLWYRRVTGENSFFTWFDMGFDVNEYGTSSVVNFYSGASEVNVRMEDDSTFTSQGTVLVRYNADGELNWVEDIFSVGTFSSSANISAVSAIDNDVILTGNVSFNIAFLNDSLKSEGFSNIFISRIKKEDGIVWKRILNNKASGYSGSTFTQTDRKGNIYISRSSSQGYDITATESVPGASFFMSKFNSEGNFQYSNTFAFSELGGITDVNVYGEDNVTIAGTFSGFYTVGSASGYAATGESAIITFCKTPNSIPNKAIGEVEVVQTDTSAYLTSEYLFNTEWLISPATAGEVLYVGNDSLSIKWSDEFKGEASISYREINACGTGQYSEDLVITVNDTDLLSNETALSNSLSIFPNPGKDVLYITSELKQKSASVHILDVSGREIYESQNFTLNNTLDISSFKPGLYLLKVSFTEGEVVKRFVKE